MSKVNNRSVVRAIMKGDISSLDMYRSQGFSYKTKTEREAWTLLHQALLLVGKPAHQKAVEFLLNAGVSPNDVDNYGNLPIYYSVRNGDLGTTKILLNHKSEVNVINHEGISPLHQSLLAGTINIEIVELLLSNGASIHFGSVKEFASTLNNPFINKLFVKYSL